MNQLNSLWNLVSAGSLRAGVLIAIVFALRWAFRGRVPAQCIHWLWILVAIRLLLPVVPGSATSIFNLLALTKTEARPEAPAWVMREEVGTAVLGKVSQASASRLPVVPEQARAANSEHPSTLPVLALVWLAGVFLHIVLLGRSALRMRRAIRRAAPVRDARVLELARECAQRLGIRRSIELRETSAVGGPALVGLWRPRLILPRGLTERLTEEELRFVLLHEYAHLRRRDLLAMWLLTAGRVIHWFNPLTWLAVRAARIDTELACDETLLRHAGPNVRVAYGETLLKLTQLITWRQPAIPVVGMTKGKRAMRLRMEGIASFSAYSIGRIVAAVGIVLGTGLIFAADETGKPLNVTNEVTTESASALPEWAKKWSISRVTVPEAKEAAEIEFRTGVSETITLQVGKVSDSEAWLEKLERVSVGGKSCWKATLRKGDERAELMGAMPQAHQPVEIEATFIEINETTIRRLRLKAPKDGGVGLGIIDDTFRGRQTDNVLTPAQAAELSAALKNAAGVEVLSTPRVTTKSTNRAVIEIIREFRYPIEWERDEKEKLWSPKAFETRNTGVTLEVEPIVTKDGAIAMNLTPQVVEFLGWKDTDTGKAISGMVRKGATRMDELLKPVPAMGNWRHPVWRRMPVFSGRKVTLAPTIQSGQMVVCADLPETENVDPFKSPAASTRLIVLVTAHLISAAPEAKKAGDISPGAAVDDILFGVSTEKRSAAGPPVVAAPNHPGPKPAGITRQGDQAGFVRSPHAPDAGVVDIRGLPPGTEVKCPSTGKAFLVP